MDPIEAQVTQVVADPAAASAILDTGMKMLTANPPALELAEGYTVLRRIARDAKRDDKSVELLKWAISRVPNPFSTYWELILVQDEAEKFDDAEKTWKEMIERFPDERNARSLALLAKVQSDANRLPAAIETIRDALKTDPNDTGLLQTLVNLLVKADKVDEALGMLQARVAADPNNPESGLLLGYVLTQAKRSAEAIAHYKTMIQRFENNEAITKLVRSSLSIVYTDMGDFPRAEAELETIFAKEPDDAGVNNDLGYLYADQGKNLEKAESMIRKAVAEDPENSAYLDSLGWVLFKRGKFQEARISLEKAQADTRIDATVPDHLGDVYFQLQEIPKAKAAWERALKLANMTRPPDKKLGEIKRKLQSLENYVPPPRPKSGNSP